MARAKSEADKRCLALERVSAAMRDGKIDPEAIEALMRNLKPISSIGAAIQRCEITANELWEFHARHLEFRPARPLTEDQENAHGILDYSFIHPHKLERAMRGNVRFTDDQLDALERIPYSEDVIDAERKEHYGLLFPGHPDITLRKLATIFGTSKHAPPFFNESHELFPQPSNILRVQPFVDEPLELRWYLVRRYTAQGTRSLDWHDQEHHIASGYQCLSLLEFCVTAILSHAIMQFEKGCNPHLHPVMTHAARTRDVMVENPGKPHYKKPHHPQVLWDFTTGQISASACAATSRSKEPTLLLQCCPNRNWMDLHE
ncbi:MAG: hypothetical protein ABIG71_01995 [Candidatus Uhrbacteria bacterium]